MNDASDNSDLKGRLRDASVRSGQATFDIGVFVLKALVTVNGGALIALLALYPRAGEAPNIQSAIPDASCWFAFGLVAAVISAMLTYCYQFAGAFVEIFASSSQKRLRVYFVIVGILFVLPLGLAGFSLYSFVEGLRTMVAAF